MRIAFLVALLAGALYYSYVAFVDLNFMTRSGRLGPGFFPRIVGCSMVVLIAWSLLDARRADADAQETAGSWRDIVALMAFALVFAVLLRIFGGVIAMALFLAMSLSVLNRGKHLQNVILSLAVPAVVYILFDRLLNANMPPALIDLLPI